MALPWHFPRHGSSEKARFNIASYTQVFPVFMAPIQWRAEVDSANVLRLYSSDPEIDWINSKPWVGRLVYQVITLETQRRECVEQTRLVASKSQMITCFTVWEYLHCMGGTVFIKVVVPDTPVYVEAIRSVRKELDVLFGHK